MAGIDTSLWQIPLPRCWCFGTRRGVSADSKCVSTAPCLSNSGRVGRNVEMRHLTRMIPPAESQSGKVVCSRFLTLPGPDFRLLTLNELRLDPVPFYSDPIHRSPVPPDAHPLSVYGLVEMHPIQSTFSNNIFFVRLRGLARKTCFPKTKPSHINKPSSKNDVPAIVIIDHVL
jgi:hypothetical protein